MKSKVIFTVFVVVIISGCIGLAEPSEEDVSDIAQERHAEMASLNGTVEVDHDSVDEVKVLMLKKEGDWEMLQKYRDGSETVGWLKHGEEPHGEWSLETDGNVTNNETDPSREDLPNIADATEILEPAETLRNLPNEELRLIDVSGSGEVANVSTYAVELGYEEEPEKRLHVDTDNWFPIKTEDTDDEGNFTTVAELDQVNFGANISATDLESP